MQKRTNLFIFALVVSLFSIDCATSSQNFSEEMEESIRSNPRGFLQNIKAKLEAAPDAQKAVNLWYTANVYEQEEQGDPTPLQALKDLLKNPEEFGVSYSSGDERQESILLLFTLIPQHAEDCETLTLRIPKKLLIQESLKRELFLR